MVPFIVSALRGCVDTPKLVAEKVGKSGKKWEKVGKVGKSGKKWEKVGKSWKKWEKVGKSGKKMIT